MNKGQKRDMGRPVFNIAFTLKQGDRRGVAWLGK